ncbi:S-layer homology domain-containing protein [Paenibacillus sp. SC116]|nr:S-layer homology domain-containing protein [Paenibacillus sp. SC116]
MVSSLVLTPFANKAEAALEQRTIGGKLINGVQEPLKVTVSNNGSLAAYLWQGNSYIGQYFSNTGWGTTLFYTESGTTTRYFSPYYAGGGSVKSVPLGEGVVTMPNPDTIVITWLLDSGDLELKQTIYYPQNERYMEKEWSIENKSASKSYSNLKLIHGGDTTFGGQDSAMSYWDPLLNMVYVKNNDMSLFGLMGFAGKNTSPADQYYSGDIGNGHRQVTNGNLLNTSNANYTDAGYYLQWNYPTLGTNGKWVIQSTETWTTAGALQVIAPPSQTTAPSSKVSYQFKLQNFQKEADIFDLYATSSRGWNVTVVEGTSVEVSGNGAIKTVNIELSVPAGATGTDTLMLTGTSQKKAEVTNVGSVTTTIDAAMPAISSVTVEPNKAAKGKAIRVPVAIQTTNVLDGSAVQVELLDENKRSVSPAITVSGIVNNNGAVVNLPVSDTLDIANYYIKVKVTGVSAIHSSTLFKVTESDNADLLHLTVSQGTLSPSFEPSVTDYTVSVTDDVYDISVTGAVYDNRSTLKLNGVDIDSNQASAPIALKIGDNVIQFEVTAPDGTTKKTYKVNVKKQPSRNALLLNMTLSQGTIKPAFASGTTAYEVTVGHDITQLSVTDLVYSPKAHLSVTGATYDPLTGGYVLPLQVGANELKVIVTAEDGSTQTIYTIKVIRQSKQSSSSGGGYWPVAPNKEESKEQDKDSGKDKPESQSVQHKSYMNGFKDDTFRPNQSITRAELAVMLWKLSQEEAKSSPAAESLFKDVQPSHWAFAAIQSISSKGIMIGVGENGFEPNRPLTRAEMAATVARWKRLTSEKASSFEDVQGHWAEKHIAALSEIGAAHGYKDGMYRPDASITRAEAVTLLNRLMNRGPLLEVVQPTWKDVPTTHWAYGDIEEASQAHIAEVISAKGERFISK